MTQPGTLRHSKAHRETVKRQWAKQMVRFEIHYSGGGDLRRIRAIDVRQLVGLPASAIVREQVLADFGQAYRLVVDIPRSERLILPQGCLVTPKGRVPAPKPGEIIEYGHITQMQREDWAQLAGRPSKLERFTRGAGY